MTSLQKHPAEELQERISALISRIQASPRHCPLEFAHPQTALPFAQTVLLALPCLAEPPVADEGYDPLQFGTVKPGAVIAAPVDHHPRAA